MTSERPLERLAGSVAVARSFVHTHRTPLFASNPSLVDVASGAPLYLLRITPCSLCSSLDMQGSRCRAANVSANSYVALVRAGAREPLTWLAGLEDSRALVAGSSLWVLANNYVHNHEHPALWANRVGVVRFRWPSL